MPTAGLAGAIAQGGTTLLTGLATTGTAVVTLEAATVGGAIIGAGLGGEACALTTTVIGVTGGVAKAVVVVENSSFFYGCVGAAIPFL